MKTLLGADVQDRLTRDCAARVPASEIHADCFKSEELCQWQSEMHSRGFCRVELVKSVLGWGIRYASGLDGFAVMAGVRDGTLDGSFEQAIEYARAWQAEKPTLRVVFMRSES